MVPKSTAYFRRPGASSHFRRGFMVKRWVARLAAIFLAPILFGDFARAGVENGDFRDGISLWNTTGQVSPSSGIAVLTDNGAQLSLLYQPVSASAGAFTLSFDFRNALSGSVPAGAAADTFFASLYFANSLAELDVPNGVFTSSLALFDLDAAGAFNATGTIGASAKGSDWSRYTLTFQNTFGFIVPVFDLRDLNTLSNDSAVAIDNVALNTAPNFTTPPQSQGVPEGADVVFTAAVASDRPVTFQWRFNGVDIPGATSATLTLPNARMPDGGLYTVAATDEFGTNVSPAAYLAVLRIESVEKTANGATVRFPTVDDVQYTLEANAQLAPGGWTVVGEPITSDMGEASVTDINATGAQRFYRLSAFGGRGVPSGYLQITIAPRKQWPAANPFIAVAEDAGDVTARASNTLDDSEAAWAPAQWTASPHIVRLTTGANAGRFFAILSHTATQLTLDAPGEDLSTVIVVGDRYEIAQLPTLGSLLGVNPTVVGANAVMGRADLVGIWNGKRFDTFFHDAVSWKSTKRPPRRQPRPDASNTILYPDEGFTIKRKGKTPLVVTFAGQVPVSPQRTLVGAKGTYFLAQPFPAALPLGSANFQTLPGWTKRDVVQVWDPVKNRFLNYTHNGVEWRKGRTVSNAVPIPPGTACNVKRRTKTGASGVLTQLPPFTLEP